jgi:alanyl-tRNA synthetase
MIGQHAFESPENYRPEDYLRHIYAWLVEGMKIPKEEIQFHEDAWAGGGNMGPSMEFFSRGLEIGNQVYMQYDIKTGVPRELSIKVLDMGMGQERPAWFTLGTDTSYEAVFPTVVDYLLRETGEKRSELIYKFIPYSSILTVGEVDVDKTWKYISAKIGVDEKELRRDVLRLAAIYSIGDHTRSLLLALNDGALPSNVGGGYNLRVLIRRSLDLISKNGWDISLPKLCELHAEYLKPQYPELVENLDEIGEILDIEAKKYVETKEKSRRIVSRLKGKEISIEKLIELYDSHGISPEMLKGEGLEVDIPPDFYIRVAERHEKAEELKKAHKLREFDLTGIDKTEVLYYDDFRLIEFKAKVLKVIDDKYVILDRTAFYPTSGGQLTDTGYINGCRVTDVFKQGNVIIHRVENPNFKEGDIVEGKVDWERRNQLAQHHTSTHIINGAARLLLGEHVWQAGAEKTPEKSRLDITHFAPLTKEELKAIEKKANEIVAKNLRVDKKIYRRDEAEAKFGFRLYQGGAVPGREIRVVKIDEHDIEACGGTHLNYTGEAEYIKVIGSTKIQDGVVRLEYVAGNAAKNYIISNILNYNSIISALRKDDRISRLLPGLFHEDTKKKLEKALKILKLLEEKGLGSLGEGEISFIDSLVEEVDEAAGVFSVSREHLKDTIERFIGEIFEGHERLNRIRRSLKLGEKDIREARVFREISDRPVVLPKLCELIFESWKEQRKEIEKLMEELAHRRVRELSFQKIGGYEFLCEELEGGMEEIQKIAQRLIGDSRIVVLFGVNKRISVIGVRGKKVDINMGELIRETCRILGGGGGGSPDFARGAGVKKENLPEAKEWVESYVRTKIS